MSKKNTSPSMAPQPLFYNSVTPIQSGVHDRLFLSPDNSDDFSFAAEAEVIGICTDEFTAAQAHYPIVFAGNEETTPVAVVGLPGEGNAFVDETGRWRASTYVPAYVRRYPFILGKITNTEGLHLCFDERSPRFSESKEGNLIRDSRPTELTQQILGFCENFEAAARRTGRFVQELKKHDLLAESEAKVHWPDRPSQTIQGFLCVSEEKLHKLDATVHAELIQSNAMRLVYAHLLSLGRFSSMLTAPISRLGGAQKYRPQKKTSRRADAVLAKMSSSISNATVSQERPGW